MSTQTREHGGALSTYRQALRSAMNSIFTVTFFSSLTALEPTAGWSKRWTLRSVIYVSLLMAFESSRTLKDRFEYARASWVEMTPGRPRPGGSYQGYVQARRRISGKQRQALKRHLREHHRRIAQRYWVRHGWQAFSVDGTRIEVPRTAANEQALGCAGRQKTGPQWSLTALYHLGTGLPWSWQIGPGTESETAHLRNLVEDLPEGSLLVADAGFTGFDLLRRLLTQGVNFLVRMGSNRTLLTGRQIREFYRMRWGQEVFYRSFKRTLEQYKMRSESPKEAYQELEWAMVAYLTMGLLSVEGRIQNGQDPLAWSPAGSLRIIRQGLRKTTCFRRAGDLRALLAEAVKDGYTRTGSKKARNWPHKKNDKPPGIPKINKASEKEKAAIQRIYEKRKVA